MENNVKVILGTVITILVLFGGVELKWMFDKEWVSLYRDGNIIAKERWVVEAERTYINLNSWYRKNIICPKLIRQDGYETTTRCYYPPNYYEQLSRSLKNTDIVSIENTNNYIITKFIPHYKYGTRGSYVGYLNEHMKFNKKTDSEENFPETYTISWQPKDTRNYRLIWRIENLKEINLPDGEYHACKYVFGNIRIDLKDECNKLEKAVIKDGTKIYFYFKNQRGEQVFDLTLVDPTDISDCAELDVQGEVYSLTSDIIGSTTPWCINITANDIILDCKGHIVDGDSATDYGIAIYRDSEVSTNVTIKSCIVSSWAKANIYLSNVQNNRIINSSSLSAIKYGIHFYGGDYNIVTNSTIMNTTSDGIILDNSHYANVTDNVISNTNTVDGTGSISLQSWNCLIMNNTINDSKVGIYLNSYSNNISNNIIRNNTKGIWFLSSNAVTNNIIESNKIFYNKYGINFYGIITWPTNNRIYNSLFNNTNNVYWNTTWTEDIETNYWNTTQQTGTRIYEDGTEIGGNFWTNSSGGYSEICVDSNGDGFCDECYMLNATSTANNSDCLALSDGYLPPPPAVTSMACQSCYDGTNRTADITPMINLTTDINAVCNLSKDNSSWIGMSTTGALIHIGTINGSEAFPVSTEYANISVNCTGEEGDGLSGYETITINITHSNVSLLIDGVHGNFNVEYNTSLNISFAIDEKGIVCLDIDAPNYGDNYECLECGGGFCQNQTWYNITILRNKNFTQGTNSTLTFNQSTSRNASFSVDNRSDIVNGQVNVTGYDISNSYPEDISIDINGDGSYEAILPGVLNGTNLTINIFIRNGEKSSENISFSQATEEIIHFNVTTSGNVKYNATFQIDGFDIDLGNNFSDTQYFNDTTTDYAVILNTTISGYYDNFEWNETGYWTFDCDDFSLGGSDVCEVTTGNTDDYLHMYYSRSKIGTAYFQVNILNTADTGFDIKNNTKIELDWYRDLKATWWEDPTGCQSSISLNVYDGTNSVTIRSQTADATDPPAVRENLSIRKTTQDSWKLYVDDIYAGTFDFSSLDETKKWNLRLIGTIYSQGYSGRDCTLILDGKIYYIERSGLTLDKNASNSEYLFQNGTFESGVIKNTSVTNNYTGVWLTASDYIPSGTSAIYEVTADNGTTWQSATSGTKTIFETQGNIIRWRVNLTGTNESIPINFETNLQVISGSITGINIDAGDDGDIDWSYSQTLNSTSSPQTVTINKDELDDYIASECTGTLCSIPISFISNSSGMLQIRNVKFSLNPNPIEFNITQIEDCTLCKIYSDFENGILELLDLQVDFLGSKNITITAHTTDYSQTNISELYVKYSEFDCAFPIGIDTWEPMAMSNNETNITPLGQEINYRNTSTDEYWLNTSVPLFNCTNYAYDDPMNITITINQTIDDIDVWIGDNISKTTAKNITNSSYTPIITNLNIGDYWGMYNWVDLWNVSYDTIAIYNPDFKQYAYCSTCLHD